MSLRVRFPAIAAISGAPPQSLSLPFIAAGGAVYAPALVPGAVALDVPFIASGGAVYAPALVPGAVTLDVPFIAAGGAVYAPALVPGAVTLDLPFIAAGGAVYAPTLGELKRPPADRVVFVLAAPRFVQVPGALRRVTPPAPSRIIPII